MIVRNVAVRHGRRALAFPMSRVLLRRITTEPTTGTTNKIPNEISKETPGETPTEISEEEAAESMRMWGVLRERPAPPRVTSASRKKQKIVQDGILSLGSDSAHEHRGKRWTTKHSTTSSAEPVSPAQQYTEFRRIQKSTRDIGSRVERRYVPTELISDPPGAADISLELLMASQTHMGHITSAWNPANSRYIYGVRQGIHVISLETTAAHLRRAARVVEDVSYRGGLILFVGNRKGQMEIVTRAAELSGACHLFTKWTPGGITNRDVILRAQGMKVVDHLDQNLDGFQKYSGLARPLLPDLVVCLNPLENYTLLYECGLKNIPTIGVIDTNADPSWVTYTIPGNDDSLRSVAVIAGVLGRAGEAGLKRRLEEAAKGQVAWSNPEDLDRHIMKETKAALAERKEVMGRMQHNVEGFSEEEQKLLRTQFYGEEPEVTEADMMSILGEAALGDSKAAAIKTTATVASSEEATIVSSEETTVVSNEEATVVSSEEATVVSSEEATVVSSEAEPVASVVKELAASIEVEPVTSIEAEPVISGEPAMAEKLASVEEQLNGLQEKAVAIEAEIKSSSEKPE
ncbi:ribosomal protein S2, flavodoxin-like domain-containing protein [Dactylonectria macrodidyma]|uniref:Ribosomal protein S2, flavodoxin-like domain-containing protein n=1 Tax=Dactylonectria macrodidyma TaxID=307937 RepID=A0A9P9JAQ8_9HYPO|nr:ribosomal protein S2, flavodoxin-like domain-containing protein [Dactylonectria macrodidyma]